MTNTQWRRIDMNILAHKKCTKCKAWKAKSEFGKDVSRKDGLSNKCRQCNSEGGKKYRGENLDKAREGDRKYREANADKLREYQRKYREANADKVREYFRAYHVENPDKVRAVRHARRARKAGNGGSFTDKEWQDLCQRYDNRCLCCGEKKKLTADHVIPLVKGGTSYIDNIQCLCQSCNSSKGTKEIDYRIVDVRAMQNVIRLTKRPSESQKPRAKGKAMKKNDKDKTSGGGATVMNTFRLDPVRTEKKRRLKVNVRKIVEDYLDSLPDPTVKPSKRLKK
jgi:5-methylcytosine-specific restriction endonuclease McrA